MNLTTDEIKTGNELIAKFMGGTFHTNLPFTYIKEGWYNTPANAIAQVAQWHNFKYHSSWDWLMPVVNKINNMGKPFNVAIFKTYVSLTVEKSVNVFVKHFSFAHSEVITPTQSDNEAMFKAIIKFIEWYESLDAVLICNNCKEFHLAPKDKCECGSTTLTETDKSNFNYIK